MLAAPPPVSVIQEWALDTANRGEAFAWRQHLLIAGLDPEQERLPQPRIIQTVGGRISVPARQADLWLISNLPALQGAPYRIELLRGLPFRDVPRLPDPNLERPLIGIQALRSARL